MEIRQAKSSEKKAIIDLWEYCFDDTQEFVEWFFRDRYQDDNTLVLYNKDRVCSALQLLPYNIAIRGREMSTSFMVGVSTWPEDRGQGYISKLLQKSLEVMRNRRQWVSILLPFNYNFYRKYGWETCYSYNLYSGHRRDFTEYLKGIEIQGRIRPIYLPQDLDQLNKCYSFYTKDLDGYVVRGEQDWHRILTDIRLDGGNGYIYEKENQIVGYIFLEDNQGELSIRTICSKDMETYREMLRFALNYASKRDQVLLKDKSGLSSLPNITERNIVKQEKPFVMGRIVDVQKALDKLPLAWDGEIVIQVIDPLLEWNNLKLALKGGKNGLSALPTHRKADFDISISVLSQLLWGYYTPQELVGYKMIEIYNQRKIKSLENLFPSKTTYIYEDY